MEHTRGPVPLCAGVQGCKWARLARGRSVQGCGAAALLVGWVGRGCAWCWGVVLSTVPLLDRGFGLVVPMRCCRESGTPRAAPPTSSTSSPWWTRLPSTPTPRKSSSSTRYVTCYTYTAGKRNPGVGSGLGSVSLSTRTPHGGAACVCVQVSKPTRINRDPLIVAVPLLPCIGSRRASSAARRSTSRTPSAPSPTRTCTCSANKSRAL